MDETSFTFRRCTLRDFLQAGLVAVALPAIPAASVFADPAKLSSGTEAQRLFFVSRLVSRSYG